MHIKCTVYQKFLKYRALHQLPCKRSILVIFNTSLYPVLIVQAAHKASLVILGDPFSFERAGQTKVSFHRCVIEVTCVAVCMRWFTPEIGLGGTCSLESLDYISVTALFSFRRLVGSWLVKPRKLTRHC